MKPAGSRWTAPGTCPADHRARGLTSNTWQHPIDPETTSAAVEREQRRGATWARLVQRLEAAGMLRPGVTRDQALRALMALTSFATYDALAPPGADRAATVGLLLRLVDGAVDVSGSAP